MAAAAHAPDFIEPVIGWREWSWTRGGGLRSIVRPVIWEPGRPAEAVCIPTAFREHEANLAKSQIQHDVPGSDCQCGIYAARHPGHLSLIGPDSPNHVTVLGRVVLWGRIVEHVAGWRAKHAYPIDFFIVTSSREHRYEPDALLGWRVLLACCASNLGEFRVPVESVADKDELASRFPPVTGESTAGWFGV